MEIFDVNTTYAKDIEIAQNVAFVIDDEIAGNYDFKYVPILMTLHSKDMKYSKYIYFPIMTPWEWFIKNYIINQIKIVDT